MNIGISTTATAQSGDLAEVARQVEALGYDSLWIPEHPVVPVHRTTPFPASRDGHMPEHYMQWADPFIALTVAAMATAVPRPAPVGQSVTLLGVARTDPPPHSRTQSAIRDTAGK